MYDCAIIGTGAAGVSAALTLKALNVNFIWFGNPDLSNKIRSAEKIRNYPGLINVSGFEMKEMFLKQIKDMDIQITNKRVTGIYNMTTHYALLCNQESYEAKTIILAQGVESVKPIPGELENLGNGVSYCATCDGFLYKDKEILVVSTNKSFEHEIKYLSEIVSKINVLPLYKNYDLDIKNQNIITDMIKSVERKEKQMICKFKNEELRCDCVFFLKESISPESLVPGLKSKDGHVLVDRTTKTNLEGVFAAGDITGRPYQYTKAVGEGNVAAHEVVKYLAHKSSENEKGNI